MGLKKAIKVLQKYTQRFDANGTGNVKPHDVQKVIDKLTSKHDELVKELEDAHKQKKKERLQQKLHTTRDQLGRARALLDDIARL